MTTRHLGDRITDFVERYYDETGMPPTIRQIQSALDISSTSVVAYWVRKMADDGRLVKIDGISRGIMPNLN
jgi:SOS-response transcriptional repressor LexA